MRFLLILLVVLASFTALAQDSSGLITGSIIDEKRKPVEGATIQLVSLENGNARSIVSDKDGSFEITDISFGYKRLVISSVGFQQLTIDSIYFRAERFDFNLNDVILKPSTAENLQEVVVYAEKPLIESKEGNITFNAGESALSAGSNASDLLTNVPLVTKDPDGKILVRGKEPKILIDEKPVELNQQQLQDFLESLPGSSIEKIEVMTNPPPQYANEQGGVINITTKKGKVGKTGRINLTVGTRGQYNVSGNYNYRRQGLVININAGAGYNEFDGEGYSIRKNTYADSINFFNTNNTAFNKNIRPNFRATIDYDISKRHNLNLAVNYNQNDYDNTNETEYQNINRFDSIYRLRQRFINSIGNSFNPNVSLSYTLKTSTPGESFKVITNYNVSESNSEREFFQQHYYPDFSKYAPDSSQVLMNDNLTKGYSVRLNYDRPLFNKKTFVSVGGFYNRSRSNVDVDAIYKRRSDGAWVPLQTLINNFLFRQEIQNYRASVKQVFNKTLSMTGGASAEETRVFFDVYDKGGVRNNSYWNFLPFANINKSWENKWNVTLAYKRTIRRPGMSQLNPIVDSTDLYHLRAGNPELESSLADNFDLVIGKTHKSFYANMSLGYNLVDDIFNQVRQRINDETTLVQWQNSSGKKEYEISTWSGYTISKKSKVNLSASYTYNEYGNYDRVVRKFRNSGSFTSNLNSHYTISDIYNATGSFTFNRFANPQGSVRSNVSMNLGLQGKFIDKKLIATINIIDPFTQQETRSSTFGTNFQLDNFSTTQTRNVRLTLAYNFNNMAKKKKPAGTNKSPQGKQANQAKQSS